MNLLSTIASDIVGSFVSAAASSPIAALRARVLEQTAAFYRLVGRMDAQRSAITRAKGSTLSPAQAAKTAAADQALAAARSQWASTEQLLSQVNGQLQSGSAELVSSVPQLIAAMATSRQLVDGVDRLLSGVPVPAAASSAVGNGSTGKTIAIVLLVFGGGWLLTRKS